MSAHMKPYTPPTVKYISLELEADSVLTDHKLCMSRRGLFCLMDALAQARVVIALLEYGSRLDDEEISIAYNNLDEFGHVIARLLDDVPGCDSAVNEQELYGLSQSGPTSYRVRTVEDWAAMNDWLVEELGARLDERITLV